MPNRFVQRLGDGTDRRRLEFEHDYDHNDDGAESRPGSALLLGIDARDLSVSWNASDVVSDITARRTAPRGRLAEAALSRLQRNGAMAAADTVARRSGRSLG